MSRRTQQQQQNDGAPRRQALEQDHQVVTPDPFKNDDSSSSTATSNTTTTKTHKKNAAATVTTGGGAIRLPVDGTIHGQQRALYRTLFVIGLRLVSFVGTQWTLRRLRDRPQVLGQSGVQLDLLLTSILFLSREGFRLALTRLVSADNQGLIWASIPVTTFMAILAAVYHWYSTVQSDTDLAIAGLLYCFAAFLEGLGEPPVLLAMRSRLSVAEKAAAETLAGLVKTLVIAIVLEPTIINFGLAQCVYAIVYTVVLYAVTFHQQQSSSWPSYQWHGPTVRLAFLFNLQGLFKHVLTQGDRIVLAMVANAYDQGVYAMGSAYGGLAARLLLQPMEESARLLFSRVVNVVVDAADVCDNDDATTATTTTSATKSTTTTTATARQCAELETLFTSCVKVVLYIGLIFSCLAVNYTQLVLQVLAGWGDQPEAVATLSAFCVYTAALAWNGMTEAGMYGIAVTGRELRTIGVAHTAMGVAFVATAPWAVMRGGTVALVGANTLSMMARALFAIYFVADWIRQQQTGPAKDAASTWAIMVRLVSKMTPPPVVLLSFVASYAATRTSQQFYFDSKTAATGLPWLPAVARHVGIGAACGLGTLTLAYTVEQQLIRDLRRWSVDKRD
jgi:oligosaccharide translocation protein RFT1